MGEAARHPMPVPVVLVTGALGAGKTSFINAVLGADHGLALAVVVNDFGAINIDEALLSDSGRPVYGLKNGCICCSLQGDLLRTLRAILSVRPGLAAIVIEASGVADPRGIMSALCDPVLREAVRLDAVVTVVDAEEHDRSDALWRVQVSAADFVFLAKTTHLEPAKVTDLRAALWRMQKSLVFAADAAGGVPLDLLFAPGARRERQGEGASLPFLKDERFARLEWSSSTPVALPRFQAAIAHLGPHLVRAKGFVAVTDPPGQSYLFQLVGRRASLAPTGSPRAQTELVLIGAAGLFDACRAAWVLDSMARE